MAKDVARVRARGGKAVEVAKIKGVARSDVTDDMIKSALVDSYGILSVAVVIIKSKYGLEISREGLRKRVEKSDDLQQTVNEQIERILDHAENALFQAVLNNDMRSIFYLLNNRAQHRGYNNNNFSINGGIAVSNVVQVYLPDNGRDNASAAAGKRGRGRPRKDVTIDVDAEM